MPPKSTRKRQLEECLKKARDVKRSREGTSSVAGDGLESEQLYGDVSEISDLMGLSQDALDTDDEAVDPSFNLDSSLKGDQDFLADQFCEDWVLQLDRDDKVSLALFLCFQLTKHLKCGATEAAELAGVMVGRSDRTVRDWRSHFFDNDGSIPESAKGRYERSGIVWQNEALNKKAKKFIRNNSNVKGRPNLTVGGFCDWVNNDLLPNETLEPGYPRKLCVETCRKWMHELGFSVVVKKKGTFVDGHERPDVVEYRNKFLRKMVGLGFLDESNAPTDEAKQALPKDIEPPRPELKEKTVVLFHDETTFQANDDQPTLWAEKGTSIMRPKSKGSGIMLSDFIEERNGYLCLTDEEYERAKAVDKTAKKYARRFLEYGESREGYWTSDKFMDQIKEAVKLVDFKYPKSEGWRIVWVFDHSSCHAAMADDSLDVAHMNVKPGGKQRIMRDGWWGGKPQKMNFATGVPKGMKVVLQERGVDTSKLNAEQMREELRSHPDFKYEKSRIERYLTEECKHLMYMLPKYHCELNPIERVWAQAKRYTKAYCKYNIQSLRNTIVPALDSVTMDNIHKHFRKVRHYMFAYLEGVPGGSELEKLVKDYKKVIQSHRRISANQ